MSLDKNLFTLHVTPNKDDPNVVDLVDPNGTIHYRKQRIVGPSYKSEIYDPMSESLLISATAPSATSKHKTLELYNPSIVLELKHTGTLSFRWSFKWEENEFEWKREECFMLRKPDPPVLVAVTKEPAGRIKSSVVQILDYNLNRFDIEDRKGLEIVILTALLTFQDLSDAHHGSRDESPLPSPALPATTVRRTSAGAPPPPPKPAPKMGIARIAEMQSLRKEINEVAVEDEGSVNDYGQYCANLLQDDAMLFITVRSSSATHVPKVLQVVEETKRIRHKTGLADNQELHQYVLYDTGPTAPAQKGPRRINLNDDTDSDKSKVDPKYTPPTSLTVHLSKIPMPELQPRPHANPIANAKPPGQEKREDKNKKEDKREKLAREAEEKRWRKDDSKKAQSSRISKPPNSPSPPRSRVPSHAHSHQVHPNQPSPSPAQLNNPGIYAAPPPRPPQNPYSHPPHQPGPPPPNWSPPSYGAGYGYTPRAQQPGGNPGVISPRPSSSYLGPPSGTPPSSSKPTTPAPIAGASTVVAGLFDKFSQWQHRHE